MNERERMKIKSSVNFYSASHAHVCCEERKTLHFNDVRIEAYDVPDLGSQTF